VARPQPGWGWHELDRRWAELLVENARLPPGEWVIDVGAGHGALTAALVRAGARVIAVEAHPGRAAYLRERFGDSIVVAWADGNDLRLPRRPYHVLANPPFAISSSLLRRLLQPGSRLVSAHLVLQREVARRWSGTDAPGGRRWSRDFDASLGMRVPRSAFRPPPRVDTQVLHIERRARR
jgi:23S rRNA (adenine-N6)-dimethyltransferase